MLKIIGRTLYTGIMIILSIPWWVLLTLGYFGTSLYWVYKGYGTIKDWWDETFCTRAVVILTIKAIAYWTKTGEYPTYTIEEEA